MKGCALIFGKEAAPKVRSGSYADGIAGQSLCLPLAVVGPHVNLPSSYHSEMASDANRFASCFLALCAKALSEAKIELDYHSHLKIKVLLCLRAGSGLSRVRHPHFLKKMEHLPLFWQTLLNHQLWRASNNLLKIIIHCKDTHFFRNCKFLRFGTGNPTFAVPNQSLRPFRSANGLFPYRINPLFCTQRVPWGTSVQKTPSFLYGRCFRRPSVQKSALSCTA